MLYILMLQCFLYRLNYLHIPFWYLPQKFVYREVRKQFPKNNYENLCLVNKLLKSNMVVPKSAYFEN